MPNGLSGLNIKHPKSFLLEGEFDYLLVTNTQTYHYLRKQSVLVYQLFDEVINQPEQGILRRSNSFSSAWISRNQSIFNTLNTSC